MRYYWVLFMLSSQAVSPAQAITLSDLSEADPGFQIEVREVALGMFPHAAPAPDDIETANAFPTDVFFEPASGAGSGAAVVPLSGSAWFMVAFLALPFWVKRRRRSA